MNATRQSLLAAALLLATGTGGRWAFAHWILEPRQETVTLHRPLQAFPARVGEWYGTDVDADPLMIRDIKIDAYLQRAYVHSSGERVMLWMSYSTRSTDQYHYPTVCMRGKGWAEEEASRGLVGISEGDAAVRFEFVRDAQRQVVYYWYYLLGEEPIDRWMRQMGRGARGFLRGRRNGSMTVELFSMSEHPDRARLDEFARRVNLELGDWLPDETVVGHEPSAAY
ncbi:MAG: EpsI family protein [Planctomycetota bacterium]